MADVITNISMVLEEFLKQCVNNITNLKYVYDENLSYETSIKKIRANNDANAITSGVFPLFVFNRSIIRRPDAINKRSSFTAAAHKLGDSTGEIEGYKVASGVIDINYQYIDPNMSHIESFELLFLGEESINSVKELTITLPNIGIWTYFIDWKDLETLTVQIDGNYYKALSGVATISGPFILFLENFKTIDEIVLTIKLIKQSMSFADVTVP